MNKNDPVLVLYLEDNPRDLELVRDTLQQAAMTFELRPARDRAEYEAALVQTRYDLILSDYGLPGYDGLAAMALAQQKQPGVPFILVSGTIGEERAVDCMLGGATDYVLKHNLNRLVPAVTRALTEAEERRRRREAENALRESEEMLRLLMNSTAEAIYGLDMDGKFTFCNAACLRLLGYAQPRDLLGKEMHALIHHSRADGTPLLKDDSSVHRSSRQGNGTHTSDQVYWRADGTCFPAEYWSYPIWRGGKPIGTVVTFFDITERNRAEQEHLRLVTAIEQASDTVVITDREGAIQYANPGFEKTTGYTCTEAVGKNPRILKSGKHDAAFYQQMWNTLRRGEVWHGHIINKRKDGSLYEEDATITPICNSAGNIVSYVAVKRDVTQKIAMEAQLRQSQKMEAIGTLAGGVAHEINNPINGIMNYAQVISDQLPADSRLQQFSANIIKETNRVSQIVRNLLSFARQNPQERSPANLNDIIKSVLTLVQSVIRHDQITLEVEVPEGLPQMECRSQQLEQVLLNLLTNARDALNEKYPAYHEDKIIRVTSRLFEQDGARWIRTTVEDHANGIPAEVRDRVLDPFFTTKPADKGTGLGLSISHGIVKDHGGELHFETETGRGTRFHMDLPVKGEK